MLIFNKILINNFLSIENIELEFKSGLTFVKGQNLDDLKSSSNASGKSSLFESLMWVIYGETSKGKSADSVVNKKQMQDTKVELSFQKESANYKIVRYRKHSIFGDDVKIFMDEKDISGKGLRQNNDLILKIISIPKEFFNSTVFLVQGFNSRFSLLGETDRRLLLEKIRNVKIWEKAKELAEKNAVALDKELTKINTQINLYRNDYIPRLTGEIEFFKNQIETLSRELNELKPDYSKVSLLNEKINSETTQQNILNERKQVLVSNLNQKQEELKLKENFNKINKQALDTVILNFSNTEAELKYIPKGNCNICGKDTSEFFKEKLENLTYNLEELKKEKENAVQIFNDSEKSRKEITDQINFIYNKNSQLDQLLSTSIRELEQSKRELSSIELEFEKNKQIIIEKINNCSTSISKNEVSLKELETNILKLESSTKQLTLDLSSYEELKKVFSPKGIRSYLISKDLEELNARLKNNSEFLFNNSIVKLNFKGETIENSKIAIELENEENNYDYSDCSGGQSRRIDLLIQLAIRDLIFNISNLNTNILILDEIFESLDREGVINVLELIKNNYGNYCVYIISHIPDLPYEYFENQINLTKLNSTTSLTQF